LKSHVRGELSREQKDFAAVSNKRRAERVGRAGNVLDVERNKETATEAEQTKNAYDALVNYRGKVSDVINEEAGHYAKARSNREREEIRKRTVERVCTALAETVGGGSGAGDSGSHERQAA
jgi:hypothetical protein